MDQPVILSKLEQEYLLRAIESATQVRDLHQLFLWTSGQLQALLPHELMVAMHFSEQGRLLRLEPLHASLLPEAQLGALCDPEAGLAPRLAHWCNTHQQYPLGWEQDSATGLPQWQSQIAGCGYDNLLAHSSGPVPGGATVFVLFGLPQRPAARHAYFLELLLPFMHLALVRAAGPAGQPHGARRPAGRPLSAREVEILLWLREGKSNADIAAILGLSALTVKNHLQRIYKLLAVENRTQAVARSAALRLLPAAA